MIRLGKKIQKNSVSVRENEKHGPQMWSWIKGLESYEEGLLIVTCPFGRGEAGCWATWFILESERSSFSESLPS